MCLCLQILKLYFWKILRLRSGIIMKFRSLNKYTIKWNQYIKVQINEIDTNNKIKIIYMYYSSSDAFFIGTQKNPPK